MTDEQVGADPFSVCAGRVISCSVREAIYVLDGLLENETVLRPREHMTDTHGYTEQLFGLCHLLGYAFMPRLADLKGQQLYRLDRGGAPGQAHPGVPRRGRVSPLRGPWSNISLVGGWDPRLPQRAGPWARATRAGRSRSAVRVEPRCWRFFVATTGRYKPQRGR